MDAPTIAEKVAKNPPESLWHFLQQMPGTMEAEQFYALLIFGIVGMVAHYVVKFLQGEISGNLISYLFRQTPKRTALALCTLIGSSIGLVMSPILSPDGVFIGWGAVIWIALTTGYGIDSAVNKGERPQWSAVERKSKVSDDK